MSEYRKKITSREAVLRALEECDEIGTESFREKYGFRESRKYFLSHNGSFYDSKAILGAAHGYQYPEIGPLDPQMFSGGRDHAAKELQDLGFEVESSERSTASGWLLYYTVEPVIEQARAYVEEPSSEYEWDNSVPNYSKPKIGDLVVLWDGIQTLGMSVIQEIHNEESFKERLRCPTCRIAKVQSRKTLTPRYKCGSYDCRAEFDQPKKEKIPVTRFRANYAAGWQDLFGLVDGNQLRTVCFQPKSQHSIREIDMSAFENLMHSKSLSPRVESVTRLRERISGGHKWTRVKTRIGQKPFRDNLLKRYGLTCAIVGPSPRETIQACHLYSFSEKGMHDVDGGLLMRSDLHSLFDAGLLRIHPDSLKVVISEKLADFPDYWQFNDQELKVEVSKGQKKWLGIHWEQHS